MFSHEGQAAGFWIGHSTDCRKFGKGLYQGECFITQALLQVVELRNQISQPQSVEIILLNLRAVHDEFIEIIKYPNKTPG